MTNPYQPPELVGESPSRSSASLIGPPLHWFWVPLAGLTYCGHLALWLVYRYQPPGAGNQFEIILAELLFEAVGQTAIFTVCAALVHGAIRNVFRRRYGFVGSRGWLIASAAIGGALGWLVAVMGNRLFLPAASYMFYAAVLVGGMVASSIVIAMEIGFTGRGVGEPEPHIAYEGVTPAVRGASRLWFAGITFAVPFVMSLAMSAQRETSILWLGIALIGPSVLICLITTACYEILDRAMSRRRSPATISSRIAAAVACLGVIMAVSWAIRTQSGRPTATASTMLFMLFGAPLLGSLAAVPLDRKIANWRA